MKSKLHALVKHCYLREKAVTAVLAYIANHYPVISTSCIPAFIWTPHRPGKHQAYRVFQKKRYTFEMSLFKNS